MGILDLLAVLKGQGQTDEVIVTGDLTVTGTSKTYKYSTATGLTASTVQTQAGGIVLSATSNEVTTVATVGNAATLPTGSALGKLFHVVNRGANAMDIYPPSGHKFLQSSADLAYRINSGQEAVLRGIGSTTWLARRVSVLT